MKNLNKIQITKPVFDAIEKYFYFEMNHKNTFQPLTCIQLVLILNTFSQQTSNTESSESRVAGLRCVSPRTVVAGVRPVSGGGAERTHIAPQDRAEDPAVSGFQSVTHVHHRRLSVLSAESAGVPRGPQVAAGRGGRAGDAAAGVGSRETLRGRPVDVCGLCSVAMLQQLRQGPAEVHVVPPHQETAVSCGDALLALGQRG